MIPFWLVTFVTEVSLRPLVLGVLHDTVLRQNVMHKVAHLVEAEVCFDHGRGCSESAERERGARGGEGSERGGRGAVRGNVGISSR